MKLKVLAPFAMLALSACASQTTQAETSAYWRFEDGTPGQYTAIGNKVGPDSVGKNPLSVYSVDTRPLFTGDVPFGTIPQTSATNKNAIALDYGGDFYTPDVPINSLDFGPQGSNAWTVELSFKMNGADGVSRLFGRDGVTPGVDKRGPLQILVVGDNEKFDVRAEILDGSNTFRDAVSPANLQLGKWYNMAATADANSLKLYLDSLDGKGYQLVAQKEIDGALNNTKDLFSIGRGFFDRPTDNISGLIDEVRLSDAALEPNQFLFSKPDGSAVAAPPVPAAQTYQQPKRINIFTGADPDVGFFEGKFWMYSTATSEIGPGNQVLYAFSSPDLKNWTKTPQPIFQFKTAPWIAANGRAGNYAWAPGILSKDGKYYLYYSVGPNGVETPARIGVAVGDSPGGVFVDSGKALLTGEPGFEAIDAEVFRDPKSGKYYLYAGGSSGATLRVYEMAPDLVNIAKRIPVDTPPQFTEGAFMHYDNGRYYLSYSHGNYRGASYSVHYATADSPTGPWNYKGPILQSDETRKGPGHHSFVKDPRDGKWVIVYHRWQSPYGGNPYKAPGGRSIAISPMRYDKKGDILPIVMSDDVPVLVEPKAAPQTKVGQAAPTYQADKTAKAAAKNAR